MKSKFHNKAQTMKNSQILISHKSITKVESKGNYHWENHINKHIHLKQLLVKKNQNLD